MRSREELAIAYMAVMVGWGIVGAHGFVSHAHIYDHTHARTKKWTFIHGKSRTLIKFSALRVLTLW